MRILIVAVVALAGCVSEQSAVQTAQSQVSQAYVPVAFDGSLEAEVRSRFTALLKDPESLQLKNIKATRGQYNGSASTMVCGFYNARNGFGGYAGFSGFATEIVDGQAGEIWTDPTRLRAACSVANAIPDPL